MICHSRGKIGTEQLVYFWQGNKKRPRCLTPLILKGKQTYQGRPIRTASSGIFNFLSQGVATVIFSVPRPYTTTAPLPFPHLYSLYSFMTDENANKFKYRIWDNANKKMRSIQ